jgi:hypothetical protein
MAPRVSVPIASDCGKNPAIASGENDAKAFEKGEVVVVIMVNPVVTLRQYKSALTQAQQKIVRCTKIDLPDKYAFWVKLLTKSQSVFTTG